MLTFTGIGWAVMWLLAKAPLLQWTPNLQLGGVVEEASVGRLQTLAGLDELLEQAQETWQSGDEEKAWSLFEQARSQAENDFAALARIESEWGVLLKTAKRYEQAAEILTQASCTARRTDSARLHAQVAGQLGQVLAKLHRYSEAASELDFAIEVLNFVEDLEPLAAATLARGTCMIYLSKPTRAICDFELAEALYGQLGQQRDAARAASNAASSCEVMNRYSDALELSSRAHDMFAEVGDEKAVAHVLVNRGIYFSALRRFDEAFVCFDRAQLLFQESNAGFGLGRVAMQRAIALRDVGQVERALQELDVAGGHLENSPFGDQFAWVVLTRAQLLLQRGQAEAALAVCDHAVELFEAFANEWKLAEAQLERANILRELDRSEDALGYLDQALQGLPQQGDRQTLAAIHSTRGLVLADQGRQREALESFGLALDSAEEELLDQAQGLGHKSSEGVRTRVRNLPGLCFESWAQLSSTGQLSAQDRRLLSDVVYRSVQLVYGLNIAESLRGSSGRLEFSSEASRRLAELENEQNVLADHRNSLLSAGDVWGDEWSDVQRLMRISGERELDLIQQIQAMDQDSLRPARGPEVRAAMQPGVALVEFVTTDVRPLQSVFCSVTTSDATALFDLGNYESVIANTQAVVELFSAGIDPDPKLLRALGAQLLDPVLDRCSGGEVSSLLISAHGPLSSLPFEALLTRDLSKGLPRADWPYLVADYDVAYVHSGTVLREMRSQQSEPVQVLEFVGLARSPASPAMAMVQRGGAPTTHGSIQGTLSEVLSVAAMFAERADVDSLDAERRRLVSGEPLKELSLEGRRFRVFLQEQASESNFKASSNLGAKILHVACHGETNASVPGLSRLLLAPTTTPLEDGDLTVQELATLDLRVGLCVLSGCDTNRGALSAVEGANSLARAALIGGANSVIATLWSVPDSASRDLMVSFYAELLEDNASRVQALAQAKRIAIEAGLPVNTWSAFLLWDANLDR